MVAYCLLLTLVVQAVKQLVQRPRPRPPRGGGRFKLPDRFSFPSSHAARAVGIALFLTGIQADFAEAICAWAAAVAMSRILLGAHYVSDVLGSAAIAYLFWLVTEWTHPLRMMC